MLSLISASVGNFEQLDAALAPVAQRLDPEARAALEALVVVLESLVGPLPLQQPEAARARCRRRPRSAASPGCAADARAIRPGRSASAGRRIRRPPGGCRRRCGGRSARRDRSRPMPPRPTCSRLTRGKSVVSTSTIVMSPGRNVMRTAPEVDSESITPWTVMLLLPDGRALEPEGAEDREFLASRLRRASSVSARAIAP